MRSRVAALFTVALIATACGSSADVEVTNSDTDTTDAPVETTDDDTFATVDGTTAATDTDAIDDERDDVEPTDTADAPTETAVPPSDAPTGTASAEVTPPDTSGNDTTSPATDPTTTTVAGTTPDTTPATTPDPNEAPDPTTVPADDDGDFPPSDAEWANHPLAYLVPSPSEVGDQWTYSSGEVVEAAPSDPDDAIPGCDVAPPITLAGIDVSYDAALFDEVEIGIAQGSVAEAEEFLNAFRDLTECELDAAEAGTASFDLSESTIDGADQSIVVTAEFFFDADSDEAILLTLATARYDGLVLAAFSALEGSRGDSSDEEIEYLIGLVETMAAKR